MTVAASAATGPEGRFNLEGSGSGACEPIYSQIKVATMSFPLVQLDGKRVIVVIDDSKGSVEIQTQGRYTAGKLELAAHDPPGDFMMILNAAVWTGRVSQESDGSFKVWLSI